MNDLHRDIISKAIVNYMNSNLSTIQKNVLAGTCEGMTTNEFYTQTLLNSIRVSTELSVNILLDVLEENGLIHFSSEKEIRKSLLHLVEKAD